VRIHDLRHSFASSALGSGETLPIIGKLLGHTQVQTTARYAHLANNPLQNAADRISAKIARAMGRAQPFEISASVRMDCAQTHPEQ
jgi:integrase